VRRPEDWKCSRVNDTEGKAAGPDCGPCATSPAGQPRPPELTAISVCATFLPYESHNKRSSYAGTRRVAPGEEPADGFACRPDYP